LTQSVKKSTLKRPFIFSMSTLPDARYDSSLRFRLTVFGLAICAMLACALVWWGWRAPLRAPLDPVTLPLPIHQELDCASIGREGVVVVLVLGQSNAANHGETRAGPVPGIYTTYDGRCFIAADPLPGATGMGGSVWMRLAPLLQQKGLARAVLLVPMAVASTSIKQWNDHPDLASGLVQTLRRLSDAGFRPSIVLWHQGEADSFAETSGKSYRHQVVEFLNKLRSMAVGAPIVVAQGTRCQKRSNDAVRTIQAKLPHLLPGVFIGPDLDKLFDGYHRYDGCHFSGPGLDAAAEAWFKAIEDSQSLKRLEAH